MAKVLPLANAVYLELRHLIGLICISRSPPPGSRHVRRVFGKFPSRVRRAHRATQRDAATYHGLAHPRRYQSSRLRTIPAPTGLRPREIGRVEARAEQSLGSADALKGSHDVQRERHEPIVIDVGQLALGLRPDELIRIEFRRIAGKAVHVQARMSLEKGPHVPTP